MTGAGGDVLFIETTSMPGKDGFVLTGQLGDVMKESARIALSYVRGHAASFGLDEGAFAEREFHIHVPAGAIPKDGPSAGITMTTALVSLLTGRPVKHTVGMTGEVTLQGRVLPIGGLKQKVLAAHAAGLTDVVLPERNRADLEEVPDEVRERDGLPPGALDRRGARAGARAGDGTSARAGRLTARRVAAEDAERGASTAPATALPAPLGQRRSHLSLLSGRQPYSPGPMRSPTKPRSRASLSIAEARRLALAAQGFSDPRPAATPGGWDLRRVMKRVGVLQIDSVNVLTRAHYLPAFSRLGPYPAELLDRAAHRAPRRLFEYWGHEASLLPVELHPLLRWRMERAADDAWGGMRRIQRDRPGLVARVLDQVRDRGPVGGLRSRRGRPPPKRAVVGLVGRQAGARVAVLERSGDFGAPTTIRAPLRRAGAGHSGPPFSPHRRRRPPTPSGSWC